MVIYMKTSIQISDSIFEEARRLAAEEHTTMKALVEEGLRKVLTERKKKAAFRLERASFKGEGLQPEFEGASWEKVREAAYEGRGS